MFKPADLPETIPVFPLPGALLLPRARLPLNIFEPRYLAMLDDVLKSRHRLIGMVQPIGNDTDAENPTLHQIGCAGRLVGFSETADGRYRITLSGVSRFWINSMDEGFSPYRKASVDWTAFLRDLGEPEADQDFKRDEFLVSLGRFFKATGMNSDWESLQKAEDEMLINSLSMMFPFEVEDKQALLEAPTLMKRRETLMTLMEFAMATGGNDGQLQ